MKRQAGLKRPTSRSPTTITLRESTPGRCGIRQRISACQEEYRASSPALGAQQQHLARPFNRVFSSRALCRSIESAEGVSAIVTNPARPSSSAIAFSPTSLQTAFTQACPIETRIDLRYGVAAAGESRHQPNNATSAFRKMPPLSTLVSPQKITADDCSKQDPALIRRGLASRRQPGSRGGTNPDSVATLSDIV